MHTHDKKKKVLIDKCVVADSEAKPERGGAEENKKNRVILLFRRELLPSGRSVLYICEEDISMFCVNSRWSS